MADDQSKAPKKKAVANPPASYEVGYAKPPVETRFKPGQSGNPRGRPKGAKNKPQHISTDTLHDIILSEAYRKVTITEGNTNGYSLQPTCAQSRMPMDRIVSGACVSFFHALHAASTIAS